MLAASCATFYQQCECELAFACNKNLLCTQSCAAKFFKTFLCACGVFILFATRFLHPKTELTSNESSHNPNQSCHSIADRFALTKHFTRDNACRHHCTRGATSKRLSRDQPDAHARITNSTTTAQSARCTAQTCQPHSFSVDSIKNKHAAFLREFVANTHAHRQKERDEHNG